MICLRQVSKVFQGQTVVPALDNVSLEIPQGTLFGLIGPDGAGKTTLFRILTTLLLPDQGKIMVGGLDVVKDYRQIRKSVGYMPGRFSLYQDLTVEENIRFYAQIFNVDLQENMHLIRPIYMQLEAFSDRRAGALSGGMKQKLALCCALIHKPQVLFLDEPTTGVDVVSRREFWDMLQNLRSEGLTIFVSTPYMDEASLCDEVALIHEGRILTVRKPSEIPTLFTGDLFAVSCSQKAVCLKYLKNNSLVEAAYLFGESLHVKTQPGKTSELEFQSMLEKALSQSVLVRKITPTVEDCFMDFMQHDSNQFL